MSKYPGDKPAPKKITIELTPRNKGLALLLGIVFGVPVAVLAAIAIMTMDFAIVFYALKCPFGPGVAGPIALVCALATFMAALICCVFRHVEGHWPFLKD